MVLFTSICSSMHARDVDNSKAGVGYSDSDMDTTLVMLVMEALMGGMEGMDPMAVEEQGLVKTSPSTPSPPGAWAQVPGDHIMVTEVEVEEAG